MDLKNKFFVLLLKVVENMIDEKVKEHMNVLMEQFMKGIGYKI